MTPHKTLPILTWHSIDEKGSVISTAPSLFRKQIEFLKKEGFQMLSISEILDSIGNGMPLPEKAIAITFDDGYHNIYSEAFPILKQYGCKGTVFLVTDYCGRISNWSGKRSSANRLPLLSWKEIEEMSDWGMEFGAHTATHPDLTRLPVQEAEKEIRQSRLAIQNHLDKEPVVFAYPYGKFNAEVKELVRRQFRAACTAILGSNINYHDPYALERIDMYYLSRERVYRSLTSRALLNYLKVRQFFRDVKAFFER